jgi:pimeloyl-ACP methyl ester carboxylesterase
MSAAESTPAEIPAVFRIPREAGDWEIHGELLLPDGPADTVLVLVPGLTYDRRYWQVPGPYDCAGHLRGAGYAVLVFDRLGHGRNSRPPATEVNVDSNVLVLHHIVQALRNGDVGGHAFGKVATVGHSYGSGLALVEAARHGDVDGVVVSGMLHTTSPLYEEVINFFHPGAEDPVIADPTLPPLYMTQKPGLRARMLEHPDSIDPEISALNERIKSTATLGEGETLPETYRTEYSQAVKVPVLLVVGEHDALFSSEDVRFAADAQSVHAFEEPFYAPEARLETHVVAGAGHSLNIHRSAPEWYAVLAGWADRHLGGAAPRARTTDGV